MKVGKAGRLKRLHDAMCKNGFTSKTSNVRGAGKIVHLNGQPQLQVSGSNDLVSLIPDSPQTGNVNGMAGKLVLVEGTLNEAAKGKVPDTIRYHSLTEEK